MFEVHAFEYTQLSATQNGVCILNDRFRRFLLPSTLFLIALAVRIKPFLYAEHFFLVPVDFDEGVYYGASVLLTQGLLPYRDFDFGHPPGIVWVFALWHWLVSLKTLAHSFMLAKIAIALIGSCTALGIYILGHKWNGVRAGILASLLYATYPEAIVSERSIFLEPLINAAVVTAFLLYESRKKVWLTIGLLLAWAVSIKVIAVIWIPTFAWLAWRSGRFLPVSRYVIGGATGFAIFFLPWILIEPGKFWECVIQFQFMRPPDGDIAIEQRLKSILRDQHLAMNLFTTLGLLSWPWLVQKQRDLWFAVAGALFMGVGFLLTSKGFWSQYNTLLALPQGLIASLIILPQLLSASRQWIISLLAFLVITVPLRAAFKSGRARAPDQFAIIQSVEKTPNSSCIFSFEPSWLIMANRFPASCQGRFVLDTYLVMLMDARKHETPINSTSEAFDTDASQFRVMQSLQYADIVVLGPRGNAQLNQKTKVWISHAYYTKDNLLYRSF